MRAYGAIDLRAVHEAKQQAFMADAEAKQARADKNKERIAANVAAYSMPVSNNAFAPRALPAHVHADHDMPDAGNDPDY